MLEFVVLFCSVGVIVIEEESRQVSKKRVIVQNGRLLGVL